MSLWQKAASVVIVWVLLSSTSVAAGTGLDDLNDLPPGEQYRQLSLILLISGGADPALMDAIAPPDEGDQGRAASNLSPDDYKTPLIRIVDQESMLSGAAFLLRFAQESNDEIQASLAAINTDNPVLISMIDMNAITEDAIIIRNAIADAISYSSLAEEQQIAAHLQDYRTQTIRIRNIMEFELFDEELERLTDEAILSVGGKLDAYQRMFDEEVDSKDLDRQFDAAKYIFNRTEKFDEKAGLLTEEIMKNVILSQSKPNIP
ncbi:MAG TPA: hypothetical protein VIS57_09205 [Xanthomonadales bacterium]